MIPEPTIQADYPEQESTASPASDTQPQEILIIAGGGGLALAGSAIEKLIGYLYSAALIWGLGAESFGLFTLGLAINTFVGMVANLGLIQGVVRYGVVHAQSRDRSPIDQVVVGALTVSLPVSILIMVNLLWGANALAAFFHKPDLAVLIKGMAYSVPFMTIQAILLAGTRSLKIMRYSVIVWVVQPLAALVLAIPLLVLKAGMLPISIAYSASYVLAAGLAVYYYLRVAIPRGGSDNAFSLGSMVRFSIPLSFVQWINYANQRTETFFLGFLPSAIDVGIYSIALRLSGLETILIDSLNKIFGPVTSELSHRGAIEKLGSLYKTMAKWAFTGALLLFLIYVLFGRRIMTTFDPTYVRGTTALIALGVAALVNAVTGPCGTVLLMSGYSGLSLMNTIVLFGTSILLDWLLIPPYGLAGATVAGLLTITLVNVLRVVEVWIKLKIHPFRWDLLKPITAGIATLGGVYVLRAVTPIHSLLMDIAWIAMFCCAYILLIILLKLDEDDRTVLRAIRRRLIALPKSAARTADKSTSAP